MVGAQLEGTASSKSNDESVGLCTHCDTKFPLPQKNYSPAVLQRVCNQGDALQASDEERKEVFRLHTDAKATMDRLRDESLRLTALADKLDRGRVEYSGYVKRCKNVSEYVDGQRSLHAPVFRLPTKLLDQIFCNYLQEDDESHQFKDPKNLEILTLGTVCTLWRRTAHSTPKFWSLISLDLETRGLQESQAMNAVNVHLRRSGTLPLTIRIKGHDRCGSIIGRLLKDSRRWLRVRLVLPRTILDSENLWSTSRGYPMLEQLNLSIGGRDHYGAISCFRVAPRLRSIILAGTAVPPTLPWHQISELTLSGIALTPVFSLMQSCSRLIRLTIESCILPDRESLPPSRPISFNHRLEHLSIENYSCDEICTGQLIKFLHCLGTLPRLKSLSVKAANKGMLGPTGPWPHNEFVALFRCSSSPLKILTLKSPITSAEFLDLISLVPTLETLVFEEHEAASKSSLVFSPRLLRDYLDHRLGRRMLPRLSHLELTVACYRDDQSLLNMLRSRCIPPHHQHTIPLRYVALRFINCPTIDPVFLSGLSELSRLSGLQFSIMCVA